MYNVFTFKTIIKSIVCPCLLKFAEKILYKKIKVAVFKKILTKTSRVIDIQIFFLFGQYNTYRYMCDLLPTKAANGSNIDF